jgi:hypothetical protein
VQRLQCEPALNEVLEISKVDWGAVLPSCVSNPFVRGDSGGFGNAPDCRCAVNLLTQFIGADILMTAAA